MDEAHRKAARRRAVISFVAAGVLVVVSVIGLAWIDDGPSRHGRPGGPDAGWDRGSMQEHPGSRDGRQGSNDRHDGDLSDPGGRWAGRGDDDRFRGGPVDGGESDRTGGPSRGDRAGSPSAGAPADRPADGANDAPSSTTTTAPPVGN